MPVGIVEVITLLLGLSGFGLQPNPKAPTADQALEYAIPDADVVAELDVASIVPGNYRTLTQLPANPQIKASPELSKAVKDIIAEVEGPRALVKSTVGIDPATDIADATAFVQVVPNHEPNLVLAVHGKFSTATIDKIAKLTGKGAVRVGAGAWVEATDGNAVAVTRTGVLLAGTTQLVKDRMADTWKAPAHGPGTNLGYAAEVLGGKPVFAIVLTMSQAARQQALAASPSPNFGTDIVKRHKLAALALYHDGMGWTWIDSTKQGLDAMAQISEGSIDILRAAQIAPRGLAKIVLGGLESYRGDKKVDEVLSHKADIQKIVDAFSGDGSFKVQLDKDPRTLRLNVRLTGKTLSEVLPFGGLVPMAAVGFLVLRGEAKPAAQPSQVLVAPPPAPGRPKATGTGTGKKK